MILVLSTKLALLLLLSFSCLSRYELPRLFPLLNSQVMWHPNYDKETVDNDVALVMLAAPIIFPGDNRIAPVCLPAPSEPYEDVSAVVTGWGTLSEGKH